MTTTAAQGPRIFPGAFLASTDIAGAYELYVFVDNQSNLDALRREVSPDDPASWPVARIERMTAIHDAITAWFASEPARLATHATRLLFLAIQEASDLKRVRRLHEEPAWDEVTITRLAGIQAALGGRCSLTSCRCSAR